MKKSLSVLVFFAGLLLAIRAVSNKSSSTDDQTPKKIQATSIPRPPTSRLAATGIERTIKNEAKDSDTQSCWQTLTTQYSPSTESFVDDNRQTLNQIVGRWYYTDDGFRDSNLNENSTPGKFMLGLARAGLMDGKEIKRDDAQALDLLAEVSAEDPENSAPLVFAAIIEERLKNRQAADELMKRAAATTRFDTYFKDFNRALYERVKTPSDYLAAFALASSVPIAKYTNVRYLLVARKDEKIAGQMMVDAQGDNAKFVDIDWVPIEYAIGGASLQKMGRPIKGRSYKEILKEKMNQGSLFDNPIFGAAGSDCNLKTLEASIDQIQKHLRETK